MRVARRKALTLVVLAIVLAGLVLALATVNSLQPVPDDLPTPVESMRKAVYLDRHGLALNRTYDNHWNLYDRVALADIPEFLVRAIIRSEDQRFYDHRGLDWVARVNALRQNLMAGAVVRGASTISEQVVRMLHPRPRSFWSRWLEGFEAMRLEQRFGKAAILEFYLNQVPYQARRRGLVQAASWYFDRSLSTLSHKEMLALAVLLRSPRGYDPGRRATSLDWAIDELASRLDMPQHARARIAGQRVELNRPRLEVDASHFIAWLKHMVPSHTVSSGYVHTTLDSGIQKTAQDVLDSTLEDLGGKRVGNGAVLIVDHQRSEILAWVVGYAGRSEKPYSAIDSVTTPRQPGSTLKPLLYAKALEQGWTAATLLDDSPLQERVGQGMHTYRNYSRVHYGQVSLREALGNSLNIPAVRAIQFVGASEFLNLLHRLGVASLAEHPNRYGDGLALGNGEVTLLELVQAYSTLARLGHSRSLHPLLQAGHRDRGKQVLAEEVAALIGNILADPQAREKEFGAHSILNLPQQTAVKTGTSSDYRDAWAIGFNDRYTLGVWMGNLDYQPMLEITGSTGPALVLRTLFAELNRYRDPGALPFSPNLVANRVCIESGRPATNDCQARDEWFVRGTAGQETAPLAAEPRLHKPAQGLRLARDPRIPDEFEFFEFAVTDSERIEQVQWFVDGRFMAATPAPVFAWPLQAGAHRVHAVILLAGASKPMKTETVSFHVH